MCEISGEFSQVREEWSVLARKEHRCSSCRAFIRKKEPYLTHSSLFDGSWRSGKLCFSCWWARQAFAEAPGHSLCEPGELSRTLMECWSEEGRGHWNQQDRLWRSLHAGILLRFRAAKREERARG